MKKLIYGMFAMILGIGLSAANVSATSYDPTGAAGEKPVPPSTPMILNHGMVGDALFGEVFRAVVDDSIGGVSPINFVTYVSIENTSSKWVAAHVRLRSGRFSIEVIDFPILLSPYDVFWFQFESVASGVPGEPSAIKLWSMDTDTIEKSGLEELIGATYDGEIWTMQLAGTILNQFDELSDEYKKMLELTQGYIEVFGLFAIEGPLKAGDTFYDVMSGLWTDFTGVSVGGIDRPSYRYGTDVLDRHPAVDVEKALTGHVFMGDFTNGLYTGYTMKAIKDFRTSQVQGSTAVKIDRRDFFIRGTANAGTLEIDPATILYNYGDDEAYSEPDWATSFGPTWNDGTNTVGVPISGVDSFSLDEVDDAIVKAELKSTFFNSAWTENTYSVAIVTALTKYLHYFYNEHSGIDFVTDVPAVAGHQWPVGDGSKALSVRKDLDVEGMIGTLGLKGKLWNLAQKSPIGSSPFAATELDWEVTMIPIGEESAIALADFCFLVHTDTNSPFVFGVNKETYPAGIFRMQGFGLQSGACGGDCRSDNSAGAQGYDRGLFELLGVLDDNIIPVSGMMMDFDFKNFPHARMFNISWDNPIIED